MAENRNFKAVIFDMDGVIFDTERMYLDIWSGLAQEKGIGDIRTLLTACIGTTDETTRQMVEDTLGEKFSFDNLYEEADQRFRHIAATSGIPVKKGARALLTYLQSAGVSVGLATSTYRARAEKELENEGLLSFFTEVTYGDEMQVSKPDPAIFLRACEKLGVKPEESVIIEDSFNGVRAGRASGAHVIMVPDIVQPDEEIRGLADVILPDLEAVQEYLSKQERGL